MWWGNLHNILRLGGLAVVFASGPACAADKARISNLSDVAFGTIGNLGADQTRTQNVCAYSQSGIYSVTAAGDGLGNSFTLSAGTRTLPYEVQWAGSAGQSSGNGLSANVQSGNYSSSGNNQCSGGLTASLIIVVRAAQLQTATAGTYSGTLTLVLAPM